RLFGELNAMTVRVAGGRVSTPLGQLPAPGLAEGEAASVLIRPEALIEDLAGPIAAEVVEVRALGPMTALGIRVEGWPGRLGLRLAGVPRHGRGDRLRLTLDLGQTFVFAADGR